MLSRVPLDHHVKTAPFDGRSRTGLKEPNYIRLLTDRLLKDVKDLRSTTSSVERQRIKTEMAVIKERLSPLQSGFVLAGIIMKI